MTRNRSLSQRGVSLIEALVAMAVMGFGMLGVAGIQATLRSNSDVAKQRSEAVRIAQAAMEGRRAFSVYDAASGAATYAGIQTVAATVAAQDKANASFTQSETVQVLPAVADINHLAAHKSVRIDVSWADRAGLAQSVRLPSIISATVPEMSAALVAPTWGSAVQGAGGRNRVIPLAAVDRTGDGAGTSRFAPPGAAEGFGWIFSNTTGFITHLCIDTVCTSINARLLSGYVRFATTAAPPTTADSRVPPDATALPGIGVVVTLSDATVVGCFVNTASFPGSIAYYCAVPVSTEGDKLTWNGKSTLTGPTGWLAATATTASSTAYRVCRYTSSRWNTLTPVVPNEEHPYIYHSVETALTNQNFLVIRSGIAGGALYTCPDDTVMLGRTFDHQPWP